MTDSILEKEFRPVGPWWKRALAVVTIAIENVWNRRSEMKIAARSWHDDVDELAKKADQKDPTL